MRLFTTERRYDEDTQSQSGNFTYPNPHIGPTNHQPRRAFAQSLLSIHTQYSVQLLVYTYDTLFSLRVFSRDM